MTEIEIKALNSLRELNIFSGIYHLTTFQCDRTAKNGNIQEVTVEILDAGPNHSGSRYFVSAISKDGKIASGNSMKDLDTAIKLVHWGDLDK